MIAREFLLTFRQAMLMHVSRLKYQYLSALLTLGLLLLLAWGIFVRAPHAFPTQKIIEIASGTSVGQAGMELKEGNFIESPLVFKVLVRAMVGSRGVQQGVYRFEKPTGVVTVAWNLSHGISGIPRVRVTFPEGTTVAHMGEVLNKELPGFGNTQFLSLARSKEGYLFPDTYFFLPDMTEEAIVALMHDNYLVHMRKFEDDITSFGKSEKEVITMASLLEGEGKTLEDKRMIAGILWSRLRISMPLQVDAVFGYIRGESGYAPTPEDLKRPSPYNTYLNRGLPPTPINNPGEISIRAALTPTKSDYLYYITGSDGKMHYAKTFAEHVANQKKYLW